MVKLEGIMPATTRRQFADAFKCAAVRRPPRLLIPHRSPITSEVMDTPPIVQ